VLLWEDANSGVVRVTILGKGFLSFLRRKVQYVGRLLEHDAIFVSVGLNDCFRIPLEAMRGATFRDHDLIVKTDDSKRKLAVWPLSVTMLKQWGNRAFHQGVPLEPPPKAKLRAAKKAQLGIVCLALGTLAVIVSAILDAEPRVASAVRIPGYLLLVAAIWLLISAGRGNRSGWPGN
jgi:hypothetical protein